MKIITLLTDFGWGDGYAGVMKGVIWQIAPETQIADLSHDIPPQDVKKAAQVLGRCYRYFPETTIHVAIVDPGVGTIRRPLAMRVGGHFFVGPDNGVFSIPLTAARELGTAIEIVLLDQPQVWRGRVSNTFHGRDIFAPAAAHLANGTPLSSLGTAIHDPVILKEPAPHRVKNGWVGQIIEIDHFGNLSTNLSARVIRKGFAPEITVGSHHFSKLVRTYGEAYPGDWVMFFDSDDRLSLSIVNGSAAAVTAAQIGDKVRVLEAEA